MSVRSSDLGSGNRRKFQVRDARAFEGDFTLLAYFPFIEFESFANMKIETSLTMLTATKLRPEERRTTITLMEEKAAVRRCPVLASTSAVCDLPPL